MVFESIREFAETFYVQDPKDGRMRLVLLGHTFEELDRLLNDWAGAPARPPCRIDKIEGKGQVRGDQAEVDLSFTLTPSVSTWVRAPARMGGAVLRGDSELEGPGQHFVEGEPQGGDYSIWLRGTPDQPHVIKLRLLVPIETLGSRRKLALRLPRAAQSRLNLRVNEANAQGEPSAGALVESTAPWETGTEFEIRGIAGQATPFEFGWATAAEGAASPVALEATGAIDFHVEERAIRGEASLRVTSFGGPFESFRVRLPLGSVWIPSEQTNAVARLISAGGADQPPVVEVTLEGSPRSQANVTLTATRPRTPIVGEESLELEGFEVEGAVRQSGHLAVRLEGSWRAFWDEPEQARQVGALPAALGRGDLTAGFEYFGQPFRVPAKIVPRATRASVVARHHVEASTRRLDLRSSFRHKILGARRANVEVDLGEWTLDEITPATLVDGEHVGIGPAGKITIPFLQATAEEVEFSVLAHQELALGAESIEFTTPWVLEASNGPGELIVVAGEELELSPRESASRGLRPLDASSGQARSAGEQTWRYRTQEGTASFLAEARWAPEPTPVSCVSRVTLRDREARVEQEWVFAPGEAKFDVVTLLVPAEVADQGALRVIADEMALEESTDAPASTGSAGQRRRYRLPTATSGPLNVSISYRLSDPAGGPESESERRVPLVTPWGATCAGNELELDATGKIATISPPWTRLAANERSELSGPIQVAAADFASEISVRLAPSERATPVAEFVSRAWIQTILGETSRRDRVVYEWVTPADRLTFTLPAGATLEGETLVDGQPVIPDLTEDGRLTVTAPRPTNPASRRRVEVNYRFPNRGAAHGEFTLEGPRLPAGVAARHTYWQLILPPNEFLAYGPAHFEHDFAWSWTGLYFSRQAPHDERDLERMFQASEGGELPETANRYLFSAIDGPSALSVRTAQRSLFVLAGSGAALVLGLPLIYWPRLRHPALAFLLAVVGLGLLAWRAELAVTLAQASSASVLLVSLAIALRRGLSPEREVSRGSRGGGSSVTVGSTRSRAREAPSVSRPASTNSAPIAAGAVAEAAR